MITKRTVVILLALAFVAILFTGCTASKSTDIAATPAPQASSVASPAQTAGSAPAASVTPSCPDANGKGVWDYSWDTRWMGYAGNHDIRSISFAADGSPDSWNGINAPGATSVTMTQKCNDVKGTITFAMDPPCSGTLKGTIDNATLNGDWNANCEPEDGSTDGKFTVTMADDNKTWTGKFIGTKWLTWCTDCPPNWAAKRI